MGVVPPLGNDHGIEGVYVGEGVAAGETGEGEATSG